MAEANYSVVPNGDGWSVEHDGDLTGAYATKEAAFEAVAAAAANAIKSGHRISISVPGRESGDKTALG